MKKIKFLKGSRHVLSREQHWKQLAVAELDDNVADKLVAKGVAEFCDEASPKKSVSEK